MSQSSFRLFGGIQTLPILGDPLAYVLRTYIKRMEIIIVITVLSYIYTLGCQSNFIYFKSHLSLIIAMWSGLNRYNWPFSEENWGLLQFSNIPFPQQWEADQILISLLTPLNAFCHRGLIGYIYPFMMSVYLYIFRK